MIELDEVVPGVYVSDAYASSSRAVLKHHNITHIVVAGSELPIHFPDEFSYKQFDIQDTQDSEVSKCFRESNEFIGQALTANGKVLIHCAMGVSRSSTLAIAFIMARFKIGYKKAKEIVKSKHQDTRPNAGFISQLQAYEEELKPPSKLCCCLI